MWQNLTSALPKSVQDAALSLKSKLGFSPALPTSSPPLSCLSLSFLYLPIRNLISSASPAGMASLSHTYRCLAFTTPHSWDIYLIENVLQQPQLIFQLKETVPDERGGVTQLISLGLERSLHQWEPISALAPVLALRRTQEQTSVWLYSLKMKKYVSCIKSPVAISDMRANGKVLAIVQIDGSIKLYSLSEIATSHRLPLLQTLNYRSGLGGPIPISLSQECIAYPCEVDEAPSLFDNLQRNLEESSLAAYPLTKEAARGLLRASEVGYQKVQNLLTINHATSHHHHSSKPTSGEEPASNGHILIIQRITNKGTEERVRTRIPYFARISTLQFSPSGQLLVVGNENAQYFFILRLQPDSNSVHERAIPNYQIVYSLFRGYTQARVQDISFARDERWLSISSDHGTSHLFRLDDHNSHPNSVSRKIIQPRSQEDISSLRDVCHLSAFGKLKLHSLSTVLLLTQYRPGFEYSSLMDKKQSQVQQFVRLAVGMCGDGELKIYNLAVKQSSVHQVSAERTSSPQPLASILNRKQIPSKSNYFLDTLQVQELTHFPLSFSTGDEDNIAHQKGIQLSSMVPVISKVVSEPLAAIFEDAIQAHLFRAKSFQILEEQKQKQVQQAVRRKAIKEWVACTEIKTTAVFHTPLKQSPLFESCQYVPQGESQKLNQLQFMRSPSKQRELQSVRDNLLHGQQYTSQEAENLQASTFSKYSQEPMMISYNGGKRDPLGVLSSYGRIRQSDFQQSLDSARASEVAPMFDRDISKQGNILSHYEIKEEYQPAS